MKRVIAPGAPSRRPVQPSTPVSKEDLVKQFEEFTMSQTVALGFEAMRFVGERNVQNLPDTSMFDDTRKERYNDLLPVIKDLLKKRLVTEQFAIKIRETLVENKPLYKVLNNGNKIYINNEVYDLLNMNFVEFLRRFNINPDAIMKRGVLHDADLNWLPYQACKLIMNNLYGSANWRTFNNLKVEKAQFGLVIKGDIIVWLADGRYEVSHVVQNGFYSKAINEGNVNNAISAVLTQVTRTCLSRLFNVFSSMNNATELTYAGKIDEAYVKFRDLFTEDASALPGFKNLAIEMPKKSIKDKKVQIVAVPEEENTAQETNKDVPFVQDPPSSTEKTSEQKEDSFDFDLIE